MVQGKIVRQPKKVIDRETLQHLAEQQHKAIDAVTADLYHDQLAAKQPIPKAIEHSWCITRVSEPVAVEPHEGSAGPSTQAVLPKGHPQISPATVQKPTHSMVCWMNFGQDFYERMKVARSTAAKHGLVLQPLSPEAHKEKETQPKEDAEPEKHHGGFFDGRYVFSLRGSESYIARAAQWRELPPELFVLLGETGFNKVRLQKEVAVKEGKSVITLNRFVLVSLADVVENTRNRFKAHLHRIYSPGWNNVKRLPEFFQAGTPWQFAKRTVDIVKEGKPFELAQRMLESTGRVLQAYADKQRSDKNGGSGGSGGPPGGAGGLGPPGSGGGEAV